MTDNTANRLDALEKNQEQLRDEMVRRFGNPELEDHGIPFLVEPEEADDPETATPFDQPGRCDHYDTEQYWCAVLDKHRDLVFSVPGEAGVPSCSEANTCKHRQVDGVDRDDPLKPVRRVADIRECSNCETLAADRGELRDMIANLYSALTRKDPGQGYLTYDNLKGCCRNPSHDECDAICKFLREARALLKRLGGGNDAQTQPCPHCGDTSQDPGHFEDCPERKTETAPVLWADHGRCDHYSRDTSICAVSNERIPQDEDGWCCGTHNCDQREIDGKTRDKGGD